MRDNKHAPSPPASGSATVAVPSDDPAPGPATRVNAPDAPILRYPPFPPKPAGVSLTPFTEFQEHGIQIFPSDPDDIEIDGLGIPTISLRVPHDTDECKTETRRKKKRKGKKGGDGGEDGDGEGEEDEVKKEAERKRLEMLKKDPIARAQEQKRQRLMMFAKKQWYEQWAEGEDLRGTKKTYDSKLSSIDRMHIAASEFRTGRIWPPASTRVVYLWDQFRLYAGLLGSPPIWIRTDQQQPIDEEIIEGDVDSDAESMVESRLPRKSRPKTGSDDAEDSDYFDVSASPSPVVETQPLPEQDDNDDRKQQPKYKRLPPRTPYFFYNLTPHYLTSDAQVRSLLRAASLQKESKLIAFLSAPDTSTAIFLSWYIRYQGLVWSPIHLNALPRLVLFFLEFLVRARVVPESERALRKAVDIAKRAVEEVPRTGKLCRLMPDKVSLGGQGCWGKQWVEEGFKSLLEGDESMTTVEGGEREAEEEEETKEEAMKRFEEELKAANVRMVPAALVVPPSPKDEEEEKEEARKRFEEELRSAIVPAAPHSLEAEQELDDLFGDDIVLQKSDDEGEDDDNEASAPGAAGDTDIMIQVKSPTSPGFVDGGPDGDAPSPFSRAFIDEALDSEARDAAVRNISIHVRSPTSPGFIEGDGDGIGDAASPFSRAFIEDALESEAKSASQDIDIRVRSPTSPGYVEGDGDGIGDAASPFSKAFIEDALESEAKSASQDINIQVKSPTSPGFVEGDGDGVGDASSPFSKAFIDDVLTSEAKTGAEMQHKENEDAEGEENRDTQQTPPSTGEIAPEPPASSEERVEKDVLAEIPAPAPESTSPVHNADTPNWALAPHPASSPRQSTSKPVPGSNNPQNASSPPVNDAENPPMPWAWDVDHDPSDPSSKDKRQAAALEAWAAPAMQPFMELMGMTTLPLRYEPGVVERSMRRVKDVMLPGGKDSTGKKWKGVQEEMVRRLGRVVLEPWGDWDDGGVSAEYRVPKVQKGKGKNKTNSVEVADEGAEGKARDDHSVNEHDPLKDEITIFVEPRVAEQVSVGMGLAGTWVQLVDIPNQDGAGGGRSGGSGGGHRGRGRGRGRGGRGGGHDAFTSMLSAALEDGQDDASPSGQSNATNGEDASTSSPDASRGRGNGRGQGRGRGRGGGHHHQSGSHNQNQKEFTFWYVEDLFMAIPSFWTVGQEEEALVLPEGDDDLSDMED